MARFDEGWIKFYRRAVNEDIGWSGVQLAVWVTLLCWAVRKETKIKWNGEPRNLPPGSVVIGVQELADRLRFSKSTVYRALTSLQERDSLRIESGTRGTIVTISNWSNYQEPDSKPETIVNHEWETGELPLGNGRTLIGEDKKERKNTSRRKRLEYSTGFEEVYDQYPRKEGKSDGYKIYCREISSPADRENLISAIKNYAVKKSGTEEKYLKHFGTFMGEWRDWLDAKTGTASTQPAKKLKTLADLDAEEARNAIPA